MALYNRQATVAIGPVGQPAILVDGLRVAFDVQKTLSSEPNTAKITVTNLSQNSRELIREVDVAVVLSAGYRDLHGPETLAFGNITNVLHQKEPPDIHSIIEVGDGQKELRTVVTVSYSENTTVKQAIEDIAGRLGLPEKTNLAALGAGNQTLDTGLSFIGPAREALDSLTEYAGLDWSIQGGELKFTVIEGDDGSTPIPLSPATGLVGFPKRLYAKKTKTGKIQKGTFDGWAVEALLQPKAEPGGLVTIESFDIAKAEFKIVNVQHKGDTHGKEWTTTMEVRQ